MTHKTSTFEFGSDTICIDVAETQTCYDIIAHYKSAAVILTFEFVIPLSAQLTSMSDLEVCTCIVSGKWPSGSMAVENPANRWIADLNAARKTSSKWSICTVDGTQYLRNGDTLYSCELIAAIARHVK